MNYGTTRTEEATAAVIAFRAKPDAPYSHNHALSPVAACGACPSYDGAQL
jgi:hypothetical protein